MTSAFPLAWPAGWPRTKSRKDAHFGMVEKVYSQHNPGASWNSKVDITMDEAVDRLHDALLRLGVRSVNDVVISTNLELTLSGRARAQKNPDDPGVAVYWQKPGQPMRVMAIDRYTRVRDNIAAIAATLNALRAIERHGGGQILERAFTGFDALPAPKAWWEILGVEPNATEERINSTFRELARKHHPDVNGGSHARMTEITAARLAGLEARRMGT